MATDTESVLDFVTKHYGNLKKQAQDDNDPANENITAVIRLIDGLFDTIKNDEVTHEEIGKQLNALKTQYNGLDLDTGSYTRYTEANNSLNMIVVGFNEVEAGAGAGSEGAGEEEEE